MQISFQEMYDAFEEANRVHAPKLLTAMEAFRAQRQQARSSGFDRMAACRRALETLDTQGWQRSYHQRLFHETFLRACARVFWKTEAPGQFARDHQGILQFNGWDNLSQEILVSTPRRCVFCSRPSCASPRAGRWRSHDTSSTEELELAHA
jgi:hypothetical protein